MHFAKGSDRTFSLPNPPPTKTKKKEGQSKIEWPGKQQKNLEDTAERRKPDERKKAT